MTDTLTSRGSPPCPGTGTVIPLAEIPPHHIVDCPACGRPMNIETRNTIKKHGTVRTRNTDAADQKLRERRELYLSRPPREKASS